MIHGRETLSLRQRSAWEVNLLGIGPYSIIGTSIAKAACVGDANQVRAFMLKLIW
ncbi:MAG: hypothetical protein WAO83_25505 [Fuerstiella sp.]